MRTIYKYPLKLSGEQSLPLPRGSRLLSAIEQDGRIMVYAEVDDHEKATETHTLYVYGTGHKVAHNGGATRFLDTVKVGPYVLHVYAMGPDVVITWPSDVLIADAQDITHRYQRNQL